MRSLNRLISLLAVSVILVGCSMTPPQESKGPRSMKSLVFLTRDGCVNTAIMRTNLDDALKAVGLPNDYQFIDADTLEAADPRGGYGTPTVLFEGSDLFGMPVPPVPHPAPT